MESMMSVILGLFCFILFQVVFSFLIAFSMKSTKVQTLGEGHAIERLCNSLYRAPCGEVKTLDVIYS